MAIIDQIIRTLIFFMILVTPVLADTLEIAGGGLSDVYSKEIEAGKKATVKIFLKSAGDPIDGYIVQFFKTSGSSPILLVEKTSDSSGIITLNGVTPSKYLVLLKRGDKPRLSVTLGDIRIYKEGL